MEDVRKRIIVLAFAPGAIVPNKLCFKSYNYMSRNDFITYLDVDGMVKYGNELIILEPHPSVKGWDHDFLSPTFDEPKEYRMNEYLKNYGGMQ